MPPTLNHELTASDYLRFNDMITRIRTLEYNATRHFLSGNSNRRNQIAGRIRQEVAGVQERLEDLVDSFGQVGFAPAGPGALAAGRCNFPYCPTPSGTCELCGLDDIHQQLLTALAR